MSPAIPSRRTQLWSCYGCYAFCALFLIGWVVLARFVPPPSPTTSAAVIAHRYQANAIGIRVGMVVSIFASALLLPWGGAICAQMLRIEGRRAPLTWAWIAAQGCVVIEFVYPCTFWCIAAFRPGDAERVQTFNDLGWIPFLGIVCTGMYQMVALAILTLRDRRAEPVYPRWFAYFQLWCAFGVAPTGGVFIFHHGPLAYDGILAFWVPVTVYFVWVITTTHMTTRAIKRDPGPREDTDELSSELRIASLEARVRDLEAAAPMSAPRSKEHQPS